MCCFEVSTLKQELIEIKQNKRHLKVSAVSVWTYLEWIAKSLSAQKALWLQYYQKLDFCAFIFDNSLKNQC